MLPLKNVSMWLTVHSYSLFKAIILDVGYYRDATFKLPIKF